MKDIFDMASDYNDGDVSCRPVSRSNIKVFPTGHHWSLNSFKKKKK